MKNKFKTIFTALFAVFVIAVIVAPFVHPQGLLFTIFVGVPVVLLIAIFGTKFPGFPLAGNRANIWMDR